MPMACRKKEKTTANLVKDVISIRMAGARVRMVKRKTIWSKTETSPGSLPFSMPIFNEGKRKSPAKALSVNETQMTRKRAKRNKLQNFPDVKLDIKLDVKLDVKLLSFVLMGFSI